MQISRISERGKGMVTVSGYKSAEPSGVSQAHLDFITKSRPEIQSFPFILVSRCEATMELTEKTARAFANEILRRCDKVKEGKL